MAIENQGLTRGFQFFPQHFHNIFTCWEAGGNEALRMAFKTL